MALPASDSFTNADNTTLPAHNASWSLIGGSNFIIETNRAVSELFFSVAAARWTADTPENDQYAQATLTVNTEPGGVTCRCATDGSVNLYGAQSDSNTNTEIFKYTAGSFSVFANVPFFATGDVIRMEVYGSKIAVYKNGLQQGSTLTDSTHASGQGGVCGYHNSSNTAIDDWSVGNLTHGLAPAYVTAGTSAGTTTTISPAWPSHVADDIGLLCVESAGGQPVTLSTPAGFVAVTNSPQATGATTTGTQISVFWCRATSSAMGAPTVADPGDHVFGVILTFRGCPTTGTPWNVTAGSVKATATTTTTFPAVTTTIPNCLIVMVASRDTDLATASWSAPPVNANLSDLQLRFDLGTISGNGGGIGVYTGIKSVAGDTGTTTATVLSSINAQMTIALSSPSIEGPWVFDPWLPAYGPILAQ